MRTGFLSRSWWQHSRIFDGIDTPCHLEQQHSKCPAALSDRHWSVRFESTARQVGGCTGIDWPCSCCRACRPISVLGNGIPAEAPSESTSPRDSRSIPSCHSISYTSWSATTSGNSVLNPPRCVVVNWNYPSSFQNVLGTGTLI